MKPINNNLSATGDEDGAVKLWDLRQNRAVMEEKPFDDFVSDFHVDEEAKTLVASSGEGKKLIWIVI